MSNSKHIGNPEGERFTKLGGAEYDRVNEFIREHTYFTAREWAILRVGGDLRDGHGVPTKRIGEALPEIAPFITDEFSRQNVHNCRQSAREKVVRAGATFLYAAMTDAYDAEETDDIMYDAVEKAKFMLECEGADLSVQQEQTAEERVTEVMREVREAGADIRTDPDSS